MTFAVSRQLSLLEKGVRQSISVEQAAAMVGSIMDPRDQLMVALLLKTGVRRKELLPN